ncbi:plasminogen-binding receptor Lp30 [Leptospira stimsonii]|uniref:Lipoprotein n=1 Tax=Leptospira stimsonii TaxID=2202203 RepID=A0A396YVA8_9LEPT|nr:hypothetical protein [Leptospira stimsonii]RHX87169.1 hypothetical protein DLM75_16785 [Leptospira stimsonii]
MSSFLNRFAIVMFFVFVSNCTKDVVRVHNPISEKDKKNYGVVAFGLFVHNRNHKDILNLFSKDSGRIFQDLGLDGVKFSEILSKESTKKTPINISPYPIEAPVLMEKEDSIQYLEGKAGYIKPFYLLLSVNPEKEYVITGITYSYDITCGQGCRRPVYRNFSVDPTKSFNSFPIKANAGEITFGGVIMARVVPTHANDPYGIADDFPGITEAFSGKKVAIDLVPGDDFIKDMESDSLRKLFYGGVVDKKNSEKLFYDNLIKSYQDGYWKILAEKKRAILEN